jgi:hypothetical protein
MKEEKTGDGEDTKRPVHLLYEKVKSAYEFTSLIRLSVLIGCNLSAKAEEKMERKGSTGPYT